MGRKYGQHFLNDAHILDAIVDVAGVTPSDTVVEIGPGKGALTARLLAKGLRVVAVEIDPKMYEILLKRFKLPQGSENESNHTGKLELIQGDALTFDYGSLGPFKVVSNIPYYITTPIIFKLIEAGKKLESMALTVQKEVARRITAESGGKDYGVLSIMVQLRCEAKMEFEIPRGAFSPPPEVDSAVITLRTLSVPPVLIEKEDIFFKIVRQSFSQRRKTLANSLKTLNLKPGEFYKAGEIRQLLSDTGIDPSRRPETLSIAEFATIANALS